MSETLPEQDAGKADILLVDDQPGHLLELEAVLGPLGENLVKAESGLEALRQVREHDFAVILLADRMAGMDGFETARLIREHAPIRHTPIIFLNAQHAGEPEVMRGYNLGAADYLVKPPDSNILRSKVAVFVELKKRAAQIQRQSEEAVRRETEARQLAEARVRLQEQAIAEHRRFENELAAARDTAMALAQAKSEFLANMSHEIRTPLSSIMGLSSILLDSKLTGEQAELVREVGETVTSLMTIVNDILDFAKMSAGKLVFEKIDFDPEVSARAALKLVSREAQKKGLQIVVSIAPDLPRMVSGDPGRLRQILANLLSNAVKFTERGTVWLRAAKIGETPAETVLRFEVIDTGIGIAEDAQAGLFQPFSQFHLSISKSGGTGLGLAIARELVDRMGGKIGVRSAPGAGSTFWFTAQFAKPAAPYATHGAALTLEGQSVLIIGDDQSTSDFLKAQLEFWKAAADIVPGPAQALKILRARAQAGKPYWIALLDAEMGETGALELARMIRNTPEIAHTTLILLSAKGQPVEDQGLDPLNIAARLNKPIGASELYDVLAPIILAKMAVLPPSGANQDADITPLEVRGKPGSKPRILVAEDNATNRRVALWQLEKLGCSAEVATNGIEVLEAFARGVYDAVLMDCRMPRMDGYEATREIRRLEGAARHTPIIAMTAHAMELDRKKCLDAGMDDYLSKPVTLESMGATLRRILAGTPVSGSSPPPQPDAASTSALDPSTMASLRAKGELLPALIETVLEEMPQQIRLIGNSLARGDHTEAAIAAHSLKGTAKIFGAARFEELAAGVEQAAEAAQYEEAAAQLELLSQECARVSRELESERLRPAGQTRR
jgi:signal transduction histidine kinase/HPt (histidine-containing phosphotransfer) domain-containing protein